MNALFTTILAASTSFLFAATHASKIHTVYQFPNPTWLENIAATRNNSLLVSTIGKAEVHMINPLANPPTAHLIANLPSFNAVLGITELSNNIFAIAAGNVTPANAPVPGSFSIWSVDLTSIHHAAEVVKIADTPALSMINGLATLDAHTLLLADSWAGNIATLNTRTGETKTWLNDTSTASNFSAPGLPLGVNGLKVHGGFVYFSNTVQSSLNRVRVSPSGSAVGAVQILAQGEEIGTPDDFAVLADESVVLGRPLGGEVMRVSRNGEVQVLADVEGVTAVAVGRKGHVAYLSSMGGFNGDGSVKAGGRVVAVEL